METLAEMKQHDQHLIISPFVGGSLNLELALMLGLSPKEIDQINGSYRITKQRLSDQAIKTATSTVSPDGTTLTVTVPSFPTNTDSPYSDLLGKLAQVMGPSRFELFNELAGDQFDTEFDRFGLNAVTYRIALQPATTGSGPPSYSYQYTSNAADRNQSNSSSGTVNRADIEARYPVLAHFLPAGFGTQPSPPAGR